MSKEILQSKIKKWISSVRLIQQQTTKRFQDKENSAFVGCIKSVLSGRGNAKLISNDDLTILETYIKNSPADDFKAALENFYVLLKKNNTSIGLKDFYEVVDIQNFAETLQKICESYEYEQQKKALEEMEKESEPEAKTLPTVAEDAKKWFDCFLDLQENIHMFGNDEVECFTLVLGGVIFGEPIKDVNSLLFYFDRHLDAGPSGEKELDLLDSVLDFCEISQRRLSDIGSIDEFRACFNKEQLDGILYFANENVKIREDNRKDADKAFKVTDGWIIVKDCEGNTVARPSKIYTNSQYVYYDLKYEAPSSMNEVEIRTRLICPDGSQKGSSPYTMQKQYRLNGADHILNLNGWGSDSCSVYNMPGVWTAEFYVNDDKVYTLIFNVEQAPAPAEPTIRIDSVRFDNCDKDCNIITHGRLPLNTKFVNPVIKYTRLRNYGKITLSYRIIQPDGQVKSGVNSPIGVTTKYSFVPKESGEIMINGWGSESGNSFYAGKYRFELLQGDKVIYNTSFYVGAPCSEPKPMQKLTVTSSTPPSTTSSSKSGKRDGGFGCGCFSTFILAVLVLGVYWYWNDISNWIFGEDEPKHDYVQVLPGIWNGTMGETDVTLEIDSILNDSVVNAVISGQFSKVRTQKLHGYIGTNDSIYLDGATKGKYFNGQFRIGMSDDGRETMRALFFDKSSGDTIRLDAHKDEIPRVRQAKSTKSNSMKSKSKTMKKSDRPKVKEQTPIGAIQEVREAPASLKESDIQLDETPIIQQ